MVTFLSGGTGTPKLLAGVDREDVAVVGNTGDDVFLGGHLVCPDLDTLLFMEGGVLDRQTWWGIEDDTDETHEALHELAGDAGLSGGPRYLPSEQQTDGRRLARWRRFSGVAEFMLIGDRDRAVHITRTGLLDEGHTLTEVTRILAEAFDCVVDPLPMSDDPVASIVETPSGEMHFQAFWVGHEGEPEVEGVQFRGAATAEPTDAVREALTDPVVIGPSNPVTSIGPMAAIDGIRDALSRTPVVAVSPFVEDWVFSGPAAKLMAAVGHEPSTGGVAEAYPYVDAFVLDSTDETDLDRPTVQTDTEMGNGEDAERVWRACERALDRVRGVS